MTRRGMPTKNVGLFYRKALNPAPESTPQHILDVGHFYLYHEFISRGSKTRIGCQRRKTSQMCSARLETGAVQHQGVLNSQQLLNKIESLKQTTSQKQTSEK